MPISILSNYLGKTVSPIAKFKFKERVFDTDSTYKQTKYGIQE